MIDHGVREDILSSSWRGFSNSQPRNVATPARPGINTELAHALSEVDILIDSVVTERLSASGLAELILSEDRSAPMAHRRQTAGALLLINSSAADEVLETLTRQGKLSRIADPASPDDDHFEFAHNGQQFAGRPIPAAPDLGSLRLAALDALFKAAKIEYRTSHTATDGRVLPSERPSEAIIKLDLRRLFDWVDLGPEIRTKTIVFEPQPQTDPNRAVSVGASLYLNGVQVGEAAVGTSWTQQNAEIKAAAILITRAAQAEPTVMGNAIIRAVQAKFPTLKDPVGDVANLVINILRESPEITINAHDGNGATQQLYDHRWHLPRPIYAACSVIENSEKTWSAVSRGMTPKEDQFFLGVGLASGFKMSAQRSLINLLEKMADARIVQLKVT